MSAVRPADMQPSNHPTSSHLDLERIAAFDDEPFTADELAHLAACAACRAERDAVLALVGLAGELGAERPGADAPRLVTWEAIANGLQRDLPTDTPADSTRVGQVVGDIAPRALTGAGESAHRSGVPASLGHTLPSRRGGVAPMLRRAAAAVLLLAGGAAGGRMSAELQGAAPAVPSVASQEGPLGASAVPVSLGGGEAGFASVQEATGVLNRAQRDYERASLWLAANDTTMRDSDVYRARLAALDQMMAASRAALRDAPQDPVLNHYYLAAWTAREATLQQLGGTLPVDKVIERY